MMLIFLVIVLSYLYFSDSASNESTRSEVVKIKVNENKKIKNVTEKINKGIQDFNKEIDNIIDKEVTKFQYDLIEGEIDKFNFAVKHAEPVEVCMQAGVIVQFFLNAKDEKNYKKWKEVEKKHCKFMEL